MRVFVCLDYLLVMWNKFVILLSFISFSNQECIDLSSQWTVENEFETHYNVTLPIEVLLLNNTVDPYFGYNDRNLRHKINSPWTFTIDLSGTIKERAYLHVEKIRGIGEIIVDGVVVHKFYNEFLEINLANLYQPSKIQFHFYASEKMGMYTAMKNQTIGIRGEDTRPQARQKPSDSIQHQETIGKLEKNYY